MSNVENELNSSLMFRLIRELWIDTDNFKRPILNLGDRLFEISKGGVSKESILGQLNLLLENGFIVQISDNPSEYQFTEKGKELQTEQDVINAFTRI